MPYTARFALEFKPEFDKLSADVQDAIYFGVRLLEMDGPEAGRPYIDTLKGSRHSNMKELRLTADNGEWRVAFAFDAKREAILLVAIDKSGISQSKAYSSLISKADERFTAHQERLKKKKKESK